MKCTIGRATRRDVLRGLGAFATMALLAPLAGPGCTPDAGGGDAPAAGGSAGARDPVAAPLSESDLFRLHERLARLGERVAETSPERVAALKARAVDGLPRELTLETARTVLLARARIAAELERGEVIFVDGWMLAESEAALALLHAERPGRGETTRGEPMS